jgi:hypothetical protein
LSSYEPSERFDVLEEASSRLAGWTCSEYRERFSIEEPNIPTEQIAKDLLALLEALPAHPSLALAALAQPALDAHRKRTTGAYYTDFRLATDLASQAIRTDRDTIIDPASGTGILLVAAVRAACGDDRRASTRMVAECICAADLDEIAIRGARLSLASMCESLSAIEHLDSRLQVIDSLADGPAAWPIASSSGFDVVLANPPWERVKLSRHEFLKSNGVDRHYGHDYEHHPKHYQSARAQRARYAEALLQVYSNQGRGEVDLFKVFLELGADLAGPKGTLGILVPGGLIRSLGCAQLRKRLWNEFNELDITVHDNRSRFFSIDTRFKFLSLVASRATSNPAPIRLSHGAGTAGGVERTSPTLIGRRTLERLSPSLAIPEVRSTEEWRLWRRMAEVGRNLGDADSPWHPFILREVDMTRDRPHFCREMTKGAVPVAEGRMVAQHWFGAKQYLGGTGRSAEWRPSPFGSSRVHPQFWIPKEALPKSASERITDERIGFCDITGQTNERTIIAALIPSGVVCGNKVPTIQLREHDHSHLLTWIAIANSIAFDWWARRIVTTTVNFFLLQAMPFPNLEPSSLPARHLGELAERINRALSGGQPCDPWEIAAWRAEIDARVLLSFGLDLADLQLMLDDFLLLDRGQPSLTGEKRSTVTRDLLLSITSEVLGATDSLASERVEEARSIGAVPFVPAEYASSIPHFGITTNAIASST